MKSIYEVACFKSLPQWKATWSFTFGQTVCAAAAGRFLDGSNFFRHFFSEGFVTVSIVPLCIFASGESWPLAFRSYIFAPANRGTLW